MLVLNALTAPATIITIAIIENTIPLITLSLTLVLRTSDPNMRGISGYIDTITMLIMAS